jgi:hypothetical protein
MESGQVRKTLALKMRLSLCHFTRFFVLKRSFSVRYNYFGLKNSLSLKYFCNNHEKICSLPCRWEDGKAIARDLAAAIKVFNDVVYTLINSRRVYIYVIKIVINKLVKWMIFCNIGLRLIAPVNKKISQKVGFFMMIISNGSGVIKKISYFFVILLSIIFLMQSESKGYVFQTLPYRPSGFWGVKWGDSPDKIGDEKKLIKENKAKHIIVYELQNELQKKGIFFRGYDVERLRFVFFHNKFVVFTIYFKNKYAKDTLLPSFEELLGQPLLIHPKNSDARYIWMDNEFTVDLNIYSNAPATLTFFNNSLAHELGMSSIID